MRRSVHLAGHSLSLAGQPRISALDWPVFLEVAAEDNGGTEPRKKPTKVKATVKTGATAASPGNTTNSHFGAMRVGTEPNTTAIR